MFSKLVELASGKKTYLVGICTIALGIIDGTGLVFIPDWVWTALTGAGVIAGRDAVQKIADSFKK